MKLRCTKCHINKDTIYFYKNNTFKRKFSYWCKDCDMLYRKINKKELQKYRKQHYLIYKIKILKTQKIYYLKNKKEILLRQRIYSSNYKERKKVYDKKYNKQNKIKKRLWAKNYIKNRLKTDIRYKILSNLRGRILDALRHNIKSLRTIFLLGCEVDYFMYNLQSKFKHGMNWDNYGKNGWVVDHIKPCCLFDLSKKSEQLKCFNYTNLQPLWENENRTKRDKYGN